MLKFMESGLDLDYMYELFKNRSSERFKRVSTKRSTTGYIRCCGGARSHSKDIHHTHVSLTPAKRAGVGHSSIAARLHILTRN